MSDFLSIAYMATKNIGLNINTLPIASVGVGVGLDYGIYVVSRMTCMSVPMDGCFA